MSSSSSNSRFCESKIRTAFCRHMSERGFCSMKEQNKCTFAHNIEEFVPMLCGWDSRCRNPNCTRFHPGRGETKQEYLSRNKIVFNPPTPPKKEEKKEEKKQEEIPKFIVRLDEDEEEDDEPVVMRLSELSPGPFRYEQTVHTEQTVQTLKEAMLMNEKMLEELYLEENPEIREALEIEEVIHEIEFERFTKMNELLEEAMNDLDFMSMMSENERENDAQEDIYFDMSQFEDELELIA